MKALVVEDDDDWAEILGESLTPYFVVERARSFSDIQNLLEENKGNIEIALVDIRLGESELAKASGLDVMFVLNRQEIPCIAVTAYDNQKAVRDALVTAGAKDVWFKVHDNLLLLREKIEVAVSNSKKKITDQKNTLTTPFFPPVDGVVNPNLVFVIMPFTEEWSPEILTIIKSVAEKFKLNVARADDIFASQIIINDIWQLINKAGLIIADITIQNANVYYELGIAHSLGKEFALIRQSNGEKTPFDVSGLRYFEYELMPSKVETFKDRLSKVFESYLKKHNITV